jgi:lipopolysaccharide export system permease protein
MRILTRYLLRAHAGPFVFALVALTGILFVNTIARRLEDLAGKGLPADVILEVLYLSLPHILALTLPMAVLVAVLYAFAQLTADNEVTALKASGASLVRLLMPLIGAALLIAWFMLWFNDRVLPDANHQLKNLIADVLAKTPTLQLTEQVINPIRTEDYRTRYFIRAARIDDQTQRMWDVTIYDLSDARKMRTIYADSGRIAMNPAQTDMMMTLFDGVVVDVTEESQQELNRIFFQKNQVELKGVGTQLTRSQSDSRTDREMSIAMLQAQMDTARQRLREVRTEARNLHRTNFETVLKGGHGMVPPSAGYGAAADRYAYIGRTAPLELGNDDFAYRAALESQRLANNARDAQRTINEYAVEYHKKYAIAFACIIFVLIGAPLAVRFPRGGVGMVIAISLAIFGIYYVSLIGGESLGDHGTIRPGWGPWAPNVLFGAIGLWSLSRLGRETGTTRGGGWDDLWLTLRTTFGRVFRLGRRRQQREVTA